MYSDDTAQEKSAPIKKAYASPQLVRYGEVRDLTRNGTQSGIEDTNPSGTQCANSGANKLRMSCFSDCRVKANIIRIGNHPLGFGLYLFDYKPEFRDQCGHGRQFGVMAQEVETVMPEAVSMHPNGYKQVDYAMLGIDRTIH